MAKHKTENNECEFKEFCREIGVSSDRPTKLANLGWRAIYSIIAYLILGYNISSGNGFFVSMMLFCSPIAIDYLRFKPQINWRKRVKNFGMYVSIFWIIIGFAGISGIFLIKEIQHESFVQISKSWVILKGSTFPVTYIWFGIGINVILTIFEWVAYQTFLEKTVLELTAKHNAKNGVI